MKRALLAFLKNHYILILLFILALVTTKLAFSSSGNTPNESEISDKILPEKNVTTSASIKNALLVAPGAPASPSGLIVSVKPADCCAIESSSQRTQAESKSILDTTGTQRRTPETLPRNGQG